jgi:hypothetical protein
MECRVVRREHHDSCPSRVCRVQSDGTTQSRLDRWMGAARCDRTEGKKRGDQHPHPAPRHREWILRLRIRALLPGWTRSATEAQSRRVGGNLHGWLGARISAGSKGRRRRDRAVSISLRRCQDRVVCPWRRVNSRVSLGNHGSTSRRDTSQGEPLTVTGLAKTVIGWLGSCSTAVARPPRDCGERE